MTDTTPDLYTLKQVAAVIGVSIRTLRYWIRDGHATPDEGNGLGFPHRWTADSIEEIAADRGYSTDWSRLP